MPVGFQTDNYDRRVLLVSDKNDGITYEPIHKEDGRPFLAEAPLIPAGFVGADGNWHAGHVDASGNLLTASGGGGGGTFTIDQAAFAQGVTTFTPVGGVFNEGLTDLTSGQMGVQRITTERAGHVNLRSDDGTEIGTVAAPMQVTITGTSPGVNSEPFNVLPLLGRTATAQAFVDNPFNTGLIVFVEIDTVGTGSVTPFIQVVDSVSNVSYLISLGVVLIPNTAPVPIRYGYLFFNGASSPSLASTNGIKYVSGFPVPKRIKIGITHVNTTTPWTYQVNAVLFG